MQSRVVVTKLYLRLWTNLSSSRTIHKLPSRFNSFTLPDMASQDDVRVASICPFVEPIYVSCCVSLQIHVWLCKALEPKGIIAAYSTAARSPNIVVTSVAVAFKGLHAIVDSTTERLEAIVTVFKIWHECFEALRSRNWFFNECNWILLGVFISSKSPISLNFRNNAFETGDHDDLLYILF